MRIAANGRSHTLAHADGKRLHHTYLHILTLSTYVDGYTIAGISSMVHFALLWASASSAMGAHILLGIM